MNTTEQAAGAGPVFSEGLGPLPDVGYLGDDVSYGYDAQDMRDYAQAEVQRAVAAERERWRELVGQLVACHDEPTCPAVEWAKAMLAGREGPNDVAERTTEVSP